MLFVTLSQSLSSQWDQQQSARSRRNDKQWSLIV